MEKRMREDEEFLTRVEEAARQGAKEGARAGSKGGRFPIRLGSIIKLAILVAVAIFCFNTVKKMDRLSEFLQTEGPVEGHDMTIENNGLFGYTVADFSEAILGKSENLMKLEVYSREISEVTTVTKAGFAKLKVFSKNQLVTYHGKVIYTIDMSAIKGSDITLDEETYTITLVIPHAEQGDINVPQENIEFGDVDKGLLALGDIKMTQEESAGIQQEATKKMEAKLQEEKVQEEADRYGRLAVLELYQPIVKSVSPVYSLEVVFAD